MFFKNNMINRLFLESVLLNDELIVDNKNTINVEKDYIIFEKMPKNITLICKIMLRAQNVNNIRFDLNVDNKNEIVNFVDNFSFLNGIKLIVEDMFQDRNDQGDIGHDALLDDPKFYVYFFKSNTQIPVRKSDTFCDLRFRNIAKHIAIKMNFVNSGSGIKNVVTHPDARYISDTGDYLFFYGGGKCEKDIKNFKQFYVKFYIKKGVIYKKLYEYGDVKKEFPKEFLNDHSGYVCQDKLFINDFNDFLKNGGLKFFVKYSDEECNFLSQLTEQETQNFKTTFEYQSSEWQYCSDQEDKILIKFKQRKEGD